MDNIGPNTEERIIQAALAVIGAQGTTQITTRAIAEKAGVNHASINYHFKSKEELIGKTLEYFQAGIAGIFKRLEEERLSAAERLRRFAEEFIAYNSRYPGVEHHMLNRFLLNKETDISIAGMMQRNLSAIENVLKEMGNTVETRFKAMAFFSGLVYPLLLSRYGAAVMGADYGENAATRAYIETLIGTYSGDNII